MLGQSVIRAKYQVSGSSHVHLVLRIVHAFPYTTIDTKDSNKK